MCRSFGSAKAHSASFTFLEGSQLFPEKKIKRCPVPAVGWGRGSGATTQLGAASKPEAAAGRSC